MRYFIKQTVALLTMAATFSFLSCSQQRKDDKQCMNDSAPVNLIIDTDTGNSTDDLFALQAAFHYQNQGKCKLLGVMQSRKSGQAQKLTDAILHYYKADSVPLGVMEGEENFFEIIPYCHLIDSVREDKTPLLPMTGIAISDRLPSWKLYRKLLSEANDKSVKIVVVGMFTNLGRLLESGADEYSPLSGKELIQKKVKSLELMGCCFSKVKQRYSPNLLDAEYNIAGDVPLAKKVIEEWPTEMYVFPLEAALCFPSVHDEVIKDYSYDPYHPISLAYKNYDEWAKGDVGQYLWDLFPVVHAVMGDDLFIVTNAGKISVDETGKTSFKEASDGKTKVFYVPMEKNADVFEMIRTFATL